MESLSPPPLGRHCDQCTHFGGWVPIMVGEEIRTNVHCRCLKPGLPPTVAIPEAGCAFWTTNDKKPPTP